LKRRVIAYSLLVPFGLGCVALALSDAETLRLYLTRVKWAVLGKPRLALVGGDVIHFGDVYQGDKVPVSWPVRNDGNGDLEVTATIPPAGSRSVALSDSQTRVIRPGETAELRAVVRVPFWVKGDMTPMVKFTTNDPRFPTIELRARMNVLPAIAGGLASAFAYPEHPAGESKESSVPFYSPVRKDLRVFGVRTAARWLSFEVTPMSAEDAAKEGFPEGHAAYRFHIRVPEGLPLGRLSERAVILTDFPNPEVPFTYHVNVVAKRGVRRGQGETDDRLRIRADVIPLMNFASGIGHYYPYYDPSKPFRDVFAFYSPVHPGVTPTSIASSDPNFLVTFYPYAPGKNDQDDKVVGRFNPPPPAGTPVWVVEVTADPTLDRKLSTRVVVRTDWERYPSFILTTSGDFGPKRFSEWRARLEAQKKK
jgi:hypothetical protein